MEFKNQKGQAMIQYLLVALVVLGLIYAVVPVFQEANKTLTDSTAPEANKALNQEGIITVPTLAPGTVTPSVPATPPPAPPPPPGPPPPAPVVGNCGPDGCGTRDLPAAEAVCGTIPGPAGVLEDGCWKCNTATGFWYWETNTTYCKNYWYDGLGSTCSAKCEHYSPPQKGTFGGGQKCYICINSGPSKGRWAYWHESSDCPDFWNSPYSCFGSFDAHYNPTCGPNTCPGVPPLYGWYVEKITNKKTCWVCDDDIGKWVNTIDDGGTSYCEVYWRTYSPGCVNYNESTTAAKQDFPFCGCITEPPSRGPDPLSTGECWMCNNGVWLKETDPAKCADFWVNDNCPASSNPGLPCADALPGTSPGSGNCWLCTNPNELYRVNPIDISNPMYTGYGQPCDKFWTTPEYPGYLNIPGSPDNVDTVCNNPLPDTDGAKRPGIIYNAANKQWGCWLCADTDTDGAPNTNYNWVYWLGGRFDHWTEKQYKACDMFWIDGNYPDEIPPNPSEYERYYEYGGAGYESGTDIDEQNGYLFITGYENSDSTGGNTDMILIKMDKNNNKINWKKQYGGAKEEKGQSIEATSSALYITGYEVSDTSGGNYDIFVTKTNMSGIVLWNKQYGGTADDKGNDIVYGDSSVYVTGSEASDIDGGEEDIFVMKISDSGALLWKHQYGGPGEDVGHAIEFGDNSVFVTGYEMSDSQGGLSDIFVMKLDPNGNLLWKKQYGGVNTDRAYDIEYHQAFLYVTGYEMSDASGGYADIFVMKLDNNGNVLWKKQYGGTLNDKGYGIHYYDGYLYVTGEEKSDQEAGANYTGGQPGKKDLFIMKLKPDNGSVIWKQQHGGINDEKGRAIASANGYLFIVGEESSDSDGGANDMTVLSMHAEQDPNLASGDSNDNRNINDWTENGSNITWSANGALIDEWTIVSDVITSATDGWTVEGDITGWSATGTTIAAGAWELEGSTINPETGSTPPHEEEIGWTPIIHDNTPAPSLPAIEWQRQYGGTGFDAGRSIAVTGTHIFVAGQLGGAPGGGGLNDILIMKLDDNGADNIYGTSDDASVVWKKRFGHASRTEVAHSLVYDSSGSTIFVTGFTETGTANEIDIFVMRLNTSGAVMWAKEYGSDEDDFGLSIDVEGNYLYVYGIENDGFTGGGDVDIVVMKLDKFTGNVVWANQYGGAEGDYDSHDYLPSRAFSQDKYNMDKAISVPGDGYIYLAAADDSEDKPDTGDYTDIAVLKLNETDGSKVWAKQIGGNEEDIGYSALEYAGNIYICGEEASDDPNSGDDDLFVMKLNSSGTIQWKKQYGGTGTEDICTSMIVKQGELYLTGTENTDPNGGDFDIYVMKLQSNNGNVYWKKQFGGVTDDAGFSITSRGDNVYITGYETSDPDGDDADVVIIKLDLYQENSNLSWSTEETFDTTLDDDIQVSAGDLNKWGVFGDDITVRPTWHVYDINSVRWPMWGSNITGWSLEGTIIDTEDIDGWSVGL